MAEVINDPTTVISARKAGLNSSVASRTGVALDWAIGGIPFLGFSNDQYAYRRQLSEARREQFDTQPIPGESALDGFFWRRSQTSWHFGAGLSFSDPQQQSTSEEFQFTSSKGIDPWTTGEIKLLPSVTQIRTSVATNLKVVGGDQGVWVVDDNKLYWYDDGGLGTTVTAAAPIVSVTSDGSRVWWATATGLYAMDFDGTNVRTLVTFTTVPNVLVVWVKQRLIFCKEQKVYELATGEETTLPTATYTHPTPGWVWTGMADVLTAVIGSGYAGTQGGIIRFELSDTGLGTLAQLTSGTSAAVLPKGEIPLSITSYLGSVVGIGTNFGTRIATVQITYAGPVLQYGPLLYEGFGSGLDSTAWSRFMWVAGTFYGSPGVIRVDLSAVTADGFNAWATDVYADVASGTTTSVARYGDTNRVVFAVSGQGVFVQDQYDLVSTGTVTMPATRFSTAVPKLFRSVRVDSDTGSGSIWVGAAADSSAPLDLENIAQAGIDSRSVSLEKALPVPAGQAVLRFTLNRDVGSSTAGPRLLAYTLRAWPTPERTVQWSIPLLCMNNERDSNGAQWHPDVHNRILELEDMAQRGSSVLLQRFGTTGVAWSAEVVVEQVQFVRSVAPRYGNNDGEDGGFLIVVLRSV